MSGDTKPNEIDYHSMDSVLERLNKITNYINFNRSRGNYKVMHGYMIDYYKEIVADLEVEEREKIWEELQNITKYLNSGSDLPINPRTPKLLDEIDIKLRLLAKRHGYLTQTKKKINTRITS